MSKKIDIEIAPDSLGVIIIAFVLGISLLILFFNVYTSKDLDDPAMEFIDLENKSIVMEEIIITAPSYDTWVVSPGYDSWVVNIFE